MVNSATVHRLRVLRILRVLVKQIDCPDLAGQVVTSVVVAGLHNGELSANIIRLVLTFTVGQELEASSAVVAVVVWVFPHYGPC